MVVAAPPGSALPELQVGGGPWVSELHTARQVKHVGGDGSLWSPSVATFFPVVVCRHSNSLF